MMLSERAKTIHTSEDLAAFITALKSDFDANPAEWTNSDLASFLGAMAAWVEDAESYHQNAGQNPRDLSPWKIVADVLMAARVYE